MLLGTNSISGGLLGADHPMSCMCVMGAHSSCKAQEEVVREAESKQALLTEAAQNTGNEAQRQEDISGGQLRRLLDAALRHRLPEHPGAGLTTLPVDLLD